MKDVSDDLNYLVYLRIKQIMDEFGIESISKLAEQCGLSKSTISSIQARKTVTLKTIKMICDSVGMSVAEFFDCPLFK